MDCYVSIFNAVKHLEKATKLGEVLNGATCDYIDDSDDERSDSEEDDPSE
jgi:hypothetical protein